MKLHLKPVRVKLKPPTMFCRQGAVAGSIKTECVVISPYSRMYRWFILHEFIMAN